MKKIALCACLLVQQFSVQAQDIPRPKLVVGIVVDQMRWDYLYRYHERYGNAGFKRILNHGYTCQNTYLNYIPSYTAPGHATIYSGAVPAIHGIVGNDWIENNMHQYCASDKLVKSIGGSTAAGQMSPRSMKSSNIGDELRLSNNFQSRVYGIALKDRGAIFPAGHLANGAFWFDDSTGNFISSSYYANQLPEWLQEFNRKKWADTLLTKNWETLYPIETYTASIADNNPYEFIQEGATSSSFPHKVKPNLYKQIRNLPAGNTLSFKLAKALIKGTKLGQEGHADMLCISLSSSDYIGHQYAPNSIEVEDMYLRLDKSLGQFFQFLDDEIGKGNYTIFLTADHGAAQNAQYLNDLKMPAGSLSEIKIQSELNAHLKQVYKVDSLVQAIINYQIFFNENKLVQQHIDKAALKKEVSQFCTQYDGIASVIDLTAINNSSIPYFLKTKIENGYYPKRCGSLAIIYQPAWYADANRGTTHGTWNPYDTHIPLLWMGWGIQQGETFKPYEVSDIAPSIAALLHIQTPNGSHGKVIDFAHP
jgi:predicted AlkP superfamily pyrophosphatase or phosphodiesterase